jgi:hypothetical protein
VGVISVLPTFGSIAGSFTGIALNGAIGILSGLLVVFAFSIIKKLKPVKK